MVTLNTFSQSTYDFSVSNQPYVNLSGSTSLNNGNLWDDDEFTIPIGFDFTISTHTFNTIYIVEWSAGGVLSSSPLDTGVLPVFVPIGQDIVSRFDANGSTSPLSYKLEGIIGSRVLKIEWNNLGFFEDSTLNDFMNMQMWLYEGTNIIEYRYGSSAINNPNESFEGETGPNVGLFTSLDIDEFELLDNAYFLTGNTSNPDVVIVEAGGDGDGASLDGVIPDGTVYRFEPGILATTDLNTVDFAMYPNPVEDSFIIKTNSNVELVVITNNLGQKVLELDDAIKSINISEIPSGIYFVTIHSELGKATKRIIKR